MLRSPFREKGGNMFLMPYMPYVNGFNLSRSSLLSFNISPLKSYPLLCIFPFLFFVPSMFLSSFAFSTSSYIMLLLYPKSHTPSLCIFLSFPCLCSPSLFYSLSPSSFLPSFLPPSLVWASTKCVMRCFVLCVREIRYLSSNNLYGKPRYWKTIQGRTKDTLEELSGEADNFRKEKGFIQDMDTCLKKECVSGSECVRDHHSRWLTSWHHKQK